MGRTGISWTDETWNPVRGCSRVSEGCRNCYAEQQAARIVRMGKGKPTAYDGLVKLVRTPASPASRSPDSGREARWTGEVRLIPEHLADPLRWKKPRRIFVNSMSDLFHEKLTNEQIAAVFGVMAAAPQHTFQVLTKRAKRMREWFEWLASMRDVDGSPWTTMLRETICSLPRSDCDHDALYRASQFDTPHPWPLPNVWLGVSVENQEAADERIPALLATPAAVRFLSCEPLLGEVDLQHLPIFGAKCNACGARKVDGHDGTCWTCDSEDVSFLPRLHWVIAGCESGPGARECNVEWLRSLRDQCAAAGVPYFLKQAREVPACIPAPDDADPSTVTTLTESGQRWIDIVCHGDRSKRKSAGVIELPYLDGVQHAAFPAEGATDA